MGLASFNRMRREQAEREAAMAIDQGEIDLNSLSYEEIKKLAAEKGIEDVHGVKKAKLIEAIEALAILE